MASAGGDHSIRVWRTSDWKETATLRGNEEEVWAIAFTPDGQQLVSGSKDHSVRLWPLARRSGPVEEVSAGEGARFVGLSGEHPFSLGPSNVLTLWDGPTLQIRQRLSRYPVPDVIQARPVPDGRRLLLTTAGGGLWLADLPPGAVSPPVRLQMNGAQLKESAFSDHAKWLAAADGEILQVWDLKNQPLQLGLVLAVGNFTELRFSRDERLLGAVTGPIATDRTVLVWDLASGKELMRVQPHRDDITDLDFSPDGTLLATASADNSCKILDLRTRREIMTLPGQLLALFSVCFSPDGRRLATGTGGDSVLIWDLETGREVLVLKAHRNDVIMLRFRTTGEALLSGDANAFHLWRAPSWAEIEAVEKGNQSRIH